MTAITEIPDTDERHMDVLHLVASGVLQAKDAEREGKPPRLPYPVPLQRGLDVLSIICLRAGVDAPRSVPDLLAWCRQPLTSWPLHLETDAVVAGDRLLDGIEPTQLCEEWAVASGDVEAEVQEQRLLTDVLTTCRAADAQAAYVAFRRLLIERPVLTALELHQQMGDPSLTLLADHVRRVYLPAPAEAIVDGQLFCCRTCQNLLTADATGQLACPNERCRRQAKRRPTRCLAARDGVHWLMRPLRTFVAAPGWAEIRLAERLKGMGLGIELWPNFDAYDIRVVFPKGGAWAIDVKDWANPFLLARQVRRIPEVPVWDQAFFVFPQERLRRSDYLRAFSNHCPALGGTPPVDALMEMQFMAKVVAALAEDGSHA
jgi:hypothetical protein